MKHETGNGIGSYVEYFVQEPSIVYSKVKWVSGSLSIMFGISRGDK